MKTPKYYAVICGEIHSFDEYESEGYSQGRWAIFKSQKGTTHGVEPSLISETRDAAIMLYIQKQQKMALDHIETATGWAKNVANLAASLLRESSTDAPSESLLKKE